MEQELVTETVTTKVTTDLKPLRSRLRFLQDIPKPTNQELIDMAKGMHEYYLRDIEMQQLRKDIKRLTGEVI
jgi:hypothetical protein